jgi:ribonuclease HII
VRAGFDEAGLGPTLGPLVVAGFATRVRSDAGVEHGPIDDLLGPLAAIIGPPGVRDGRLEVGDSKKIHAGAHKLARIERSALATVGWVHGKIPGSVSELLELVLVREFDLPEDRRAPWWAMLDEALPIATDRARLEHDAGRLREVADAAGVTPLWYRADLVSAARINRELAAEHLREGTKNTWATHAVLRLAKLAVDSVDAPSIALWCDKAGGRQAYLEPLRRVWPEPDQRIDLLLEQRDRSHYRVELGSRRIELGFAMGGDRLDPRISWGSILAKYLRELTLRAFNRYFVGRVNGLRPTAGYPEDAKRFIAQVNAALGEGGLERDAWIRTK